MPVYAYKCSACHYEFELQQSFSDGPIEVCPNCGESSARRLITPVGIIFKGSGFYITDNRKAPSDGKSTPTTSATSGKTKEQASAAT